jgi:hypothetical protein
MSTKLVPAALVPTVQNTYWRERDAELILAAWAQSGLTLSAFARQCGLSVPRLRRWKKRLESGDGPRFYPVELIDGRKGRPEPGSEGSGIEVMVGSGRRVAVRRGFDRGLLIDLIETLESC